jgi:hypothetical protein
MCANPANVCGTMIFTCVVFDFFWSVRAIFYDEIEEEEEVFDFFWSVRAIFYDEIEEEEEDDDDESTPTTKRLIEQEGLAPPRLCEFQHA